MFTRNFYMGLSAQMMGAANGFSFQTKDVIGNTYTASNYITNGAQWGAAALKPVTYGKGKNPSSSPGTFFGSGDTPPTLDDFQMAGEHMTKAQFTVASSISEDRTLVTMTYTIVNTDTSPFTIREVGMYNNVGGNYGLIYRTVLDSPVTIEAGGVGQVSVNVRVNIPE